MGVCCLSFLLVSFNGSRTSSHLTPCLTLEDLKTSNRLSNWFIRPVESKGESSPPGNGVSFVPTFFLTPPRANGFAKFCFSLFFPAESRPTLRSFLCFFCTFNHHNHIPHRIVTYSRIIEMPFTTKFSVVLCLALVFAASGQRALAVNDWSVPCTQGKCSWELPADSGASGTVHIVSLCFSWSGFCGPFAHDLSSHT